MFFNESKNERRRSWGGILSDLIFGSGYYFQAAAQNIIAKQKKRAARMAALFFLIIMGFLFMMGALAMFLSEQFNFSDWIGFALVGLGLLFLGIVVPAFIKHLA